MMRLLAAMLLLFGLAGCAATPRPAETPPAAEAGGPPPPPGAASSLRALRTGVLARPEDAAGYAALAEAAQAAGELHEASAAIGRALAIGPPNPRWLLLQARLALSLADPAKAATAYRAMLAAEPNRIEALTGLGVSLTLLGQHAEAEAQLRAALQQRPRDWSMRSNLGFALVSAGDPAAAVRLLAEAERDIRAPQMAKHNLALALIATGERERAVRLIRTDMGPTEAEQLAHDLEAYAAGLRHHPAPPPG